METTHMDLALACDRAYHSFNLSDGSVEVLADISRKDCVIYAIRGSESIHTRTGFADWLRNLMFWTRDRGDYQAHHGFSFGWDRISDKIMAHYAAHSNGRPMIVTGHSQGGAIALIGALRMIINGRLPEGSKCVTFGAPRCIVTDDLPDDTKSAIGSVTTSYVHARDPVPGSSSFAGYDYIGQKVLAGKSRAPWYKQRSRFHDIQSYLENV